MVDDRPTRLLGGLLHTPISRPAQLGLPVGGLTPDEVETLPQGVAHSGTTRAEVRDTVGCVRVREELRNVSVPRGSDVAAPSPCPDVRPTHMSRHPTTTSTGEQMTSLYPSRDRLNENRSLTE